MMFLKEVFLALLGLSFGFTVSGGVFTVLITVGLIPRFAGKMHIAKKVFILEEMVVLGAIAGDLCSIYADKCGIGEWALSRRIFGNSATETVWHVIAVVILILFGLFSGIFVGSLALAIAEMLNSIPIFARRVGFRHGLGFAVLAVAIGKLIGSLIYFIQGFAATVS